MSDTITDAEINDIEEDLSGLLRMFNPRNEDERTPLEEFRRIIAALRAERAEVARLRKQLDTLPVFSVMSDAPPPKKDRGPCVHLHRSMDNQCFDCGWQVPE